MTDFLKSKKRFQKNRGISLCFLSLAVANTLFVHVFCMSRDTCICYTVCLLEKTGCSGRLSSYSIFGGLRANLPVKGIAISCKYEPFDTHTFSFWPDVGVIMNALFLVFCLYPKIVEPSVKSLVYIIQSIEDSPF